MYGPIIFNGCPDSDGDSIPDNKDQYPTVKGVKENNGCPKAADAGDAVGLAVLLAQLRRELLNGHAELVVRRRGLIGCRHVRLVAVGGSLDRLRGERLALAVADEVSFTFVADRQIRDVVDQLAVVANRLAVDVDDDVAVLDAGLDRRACPARRSRLARRALPADRTPFAVLGHVGDPHAEVAAVDLALLELREEALGGVDRRREAEALRAAGADGGIDADHFAVDVEQRAAGVAEVDGGVGLDEVLERAGLLAEAERAALRRDDADGERVLELERIADRDGPVALADAVGVAERNATAAPGRRRSSAARCRWPGRGR